MSDAVELTLLSGHVQEISRDLRLIRLQMDNMASRLTGQDGRLGGIDGRLGVLEKSFHDLVSEVSRGFGLQQQQIARLERRMDTVDAGLTAVRSEIAESTSRIIDVLQEPK